jgi:hypothetical protein
MSRQCWFRPARVWINPQPEAGIVGGWFQSYWRSGIFHCFVQGHQEDEWGPGNFPAAIVEASDGTVHVTYAECVNFGVTKPEEGR